MALGPPRTRRRRHRRRRDGPRQDGADMRLPRRARRRAAATAARCRVFARRGDASVGIDFGPDDDALALAPRVEQMGSKGQSRGTPPVRDQLRRRRSSGPSATGFISGPSFIAAAARRSVRGFVRHLRGVVRLFAPFGRGFAAEEVGLRRAGRGPTDPEPARAHHAAVQARAHGSSSAALGHARAEFSPRTLVRHYFENHDNHGLLSAPKYNCQIGPSSTFAAPAGLGPWKASIEKWQRRSASAATPTRGPRKSSSPFAAPSRFGI
mmetsp:Transcript_12693/g.42367  ORF Transcript_12693/g.42367 Transcript_12693/m.42367 type:complete len:266 (+) Transcript_12693:259-1056(+)